MPNVTISVPEDLKTEMEALSEVNWSEVCRHAISRYIAQRKNPTPNIELDLRIATLIAHATHETGYPTLNLNLRIHNKMDSEIMVDRILSNSSLFQQGKHIGYLGAAHDLHRKYIAPHSVGLATIHIQFPEEKIRKLKDVITSSFDCNVTCRVFVDNFRNEYRKEVKTTIPIDHWNDLVRKTLKTP